MQGCNCREPHVHPCQQHHINQQILGVPWLQFNTAVAAATAAKSLQSCQTLCDPIDGSPPSLGFSRQEHWSGLPFPPMHESEKSK